MFGMPCHACPRAVENHDRGQASSVSTVPPTPAPGFQATRRRWRLFQFRVFAVMLGIVMAWGVPELVLRIWQPVLEQYRGIYFSGDPNSPLLFQTDPRLHWKLRPDTRVTFLQIPVVINRDGMRGPET